jgi:hopanoid biosynthesis associated radical SAM protein HpnJ
MRTLFLNPPSFQGFDGGAGSRYQAKREVLSLWFPTWLAQAAAMIEQSRVVDACAEEMTVDDVVRIANDFDLVVIYTCTASFSNDAETARKIKGRRTDISIAMVGPHVSVLPEEALKEATAVDFVVRREFEFPIKYVAEGQSIAEVAGLSWRDGDVIRHNEDSVPVQDLDSLPQVVDIYKRDLKIEKYYNGYLDHPYLSIYTARGCPACCTYCLWPHALTMGKYRSRSAESVQKELARAKELFPEVKEFFLDDDTFTAVPKRTIEIANAIKPLGIKWSATSRANVPYEVLKVLKESGLHLLLVGYESGNDQILKNIKKGVTTEQMRRFTKDCKSLGIAIHGCFIVGLPGETKETIEETIKFALELDPFSIQVSLPAPYPGTVFYKQAVENNWLLPEHLVASDGTQKCPIQYPGLSAEEILEARDRFYDKFIWRPRVILRFLNEMIRDKDMMRRRLREGREFFSFRSDQRKVEKEQKAARG